jgi:TPP-dependent trihydroxycyclohexane-1,2-dione (THcHDO) dehydratase
LGQVPDHSGTTVRLTVAQAVVRFLANQYSERDGVERRLIPGCFGIFGHGNVAGVGQALLQAHATGEADLPYYLARNEQGMVHAATVCVPGTVSRPLSSAFGASRPCITTRRAPSMIARCGVPTHTWRSAAC